ncbi:MAG: NAD(P)H-hydrate dehydratase [Halioglobus sp.]
MNYEGMQPLYTAAQTRALDRAAIDSGIPGITLMTKAAHAAFDCMRSQWPDAKQVQVLCGTGNNGGDGFLLADIAHKRGLQVTVLQLGDPNKIEGDALTARKQALANGVPVQTFDGAIVPLGIVVDAMLGTGLGGDVRGDYIDAIAQINGLGLPVLALDIPSGLCSDTGRVLGVAVRADVTISFIGLKRGLLTASGSDYCGDLEFADLDVPVEVIDGLPHSAVRVDLEAMLEQIPLRSAASHKGLYGNVLVIGGDHGMAGAAILAAEAALRCGAGLVRVATRPEHVAAVVARAPEAMARGINSTLDLLAMVDEANALVVGPGLGQSEWSEQLLRVAADSGKTLILDADALNLLALERGIEQASRPNWILTPHPGEAARLLAQTNLHVQRDRFAAATALQDRFGGVAVLKGNGTLVRSASSTLLCDYGNPGMASGGMGDVLSGVLGSLVAQGLSLTDAASLGVALHAAAADIAAAEEGERGLLATDLIPRMRALLG